MTAPLSAATTAITITLPPTAFADRETFWQPDVPARPPVDLQALLAAMNTEDAEERSWQSRALCAETDPEAFFPEKGGSTREAKAICTRCEVRAECLEYALANDERFGIWGGLSERERRRLRRFGE